MRAGPLRWYEFDPFTLDLKVAALALVAAVLAFVLHRGLLQLVAIMAALGIAVRLSVMTAYVIGEIEVTDPAAYEEYRKQVLAVVTKYGGKFLVRGGKVDAKEGGWTPKRIVLLEFPSMAQAQKWYDSPEYAPLIKLRQKASKGKLIMVEGAQ